MEIGGCFLCYFCSSLWASAHFPLLGSEGLRPLEAVVIRLETPALTGVTAAVSEIIATLLTTRLQF